MSLSPSPTILLPDLPPKTLVGIDLITFTSTPNFHGIRDLPDGWHFLYTGTTESFSLRCGAWFYVGDINATNNINKNDGTIIIRQGNKNLGPEVYIWKWNSDIEALVPLRNDSDTDRQEAMRHKANLGAVWRSGRLFRYRSRVSSSSLTNSKDGKQAQARDQYEEGEDEEEEGRRDWEQLTNSISPSLLSRILGDPEVDVDGRPRWTVTSASTANRDADVIPGLSSPGQGQEKGIGEIAGGQEREFTFLPVDLKQTWREGAIGRERTEAAQDRSWALGDLISRYSGSNLGPTKTTESDGEQSGESQILGELQFTFLMVLTLMNYSCLQQWKRLLDLILTCRNAIKDREQFMANAISLLLSQLKRCDDVEGGLFEMDDGGHGGGEFLRRLLMKFKQSVNEVVVDGAAASASAVKVELDELESWVKHEYDWDLNRVALVRRGMIQLEDGEEVELEMEDDEDEETGEYAPVVVDMGDREDVHMQME